MKRPRGKQFAVVLLVALAVRLIAGWIWQTRLEGQFGFGDSLSYWQLGRAVAQGGPYRYGQDGYWIFRTPGYPVMLAMVFWVAGPDPSPMWGRVLSAFCGTLAVVGVCWLGSRLFDAETGMIAAVVAAVYPGAIATSALVLSEAPFCPLMLAHLGLWIVAWQTSAPSQTGVLKNGGGHHKRQSLHHSQDAISCGANPDFSVALGRAGLVAFSAGLVAGAATLVRPSWLLFTPFALLIGLATAKARRKTFALGGAMLLGLAVAMTPWWVRNARLTGRFVPTTLQVGASLYDGLNPQATGASNMDFVGRFAGTEPGADDSPESCPAAAEYRMDRRIGESAIRWARENPRRVLELAAVKFVRMWNVWPNESSLSRWPIRLAVLVTYLPVLALGIIGACRTFRGGFPFLLCWLPAIYFTLLHVIFVSSIRYRQPAMLVLMVLAAGVVMEEIRKWKTTSARGSRNGGNACES